MVVANELSLLNVRWTTFDDSRGRGSNIDVTLVTKDFGRQEWGWSIGHTPLSDHRVIVLENRGRERRRNAEKNRMDSGKWDINKVKWRELREYLRDKIGGYSEERDVNLRGTGMEKYIPKTDSGQSVNWWTSELDELRRDMRRKRKSWLRYREEDRLIFTRSKKKYFSRIRKRVWLELIAEMESGEYYEGPYSVLMGKTKGRNVVTNVKRADGTMTKSLSEMVEIP